ncbi:MAG: DEAD/DEAH box helicase family protein [Candidatus Omnitrophica bacterium]|nr:DEAD/DEAH box helicase family protein [Candidatus Omnitrophota bacterium]
MFNPLNFQEEAVEDLLSRILLIWNREDRQMPLVFKSPTGSGKTFMLAHCIRGLNHLPNWDYDKAFVWITFSDDLAMQSKYKFEKYFENTLENRLLTVDDINQGKLYKNDILFLNWQKVVSRKAEDRVLRRPEEEIMRKETGVYFEDFIDATHSDNREIILIIDEAHTHVTKDLAQQIIDYIDPRIIIHVTATPDQEIELLAYRINSFVEVPRDKVVEEGLIKEKIVIQTNEELRKHKGEDLDKVLLDLGFDKRSNLRKQFEKLSKNVNPLMLIQLPNDDKELRERKEKTKEEIVLEYLKEKGVHENQIALWFDSHRKNLDFISDNNSSIDFMLFKQAAGTGWDCPRAHVLVMFREITSPTFYVQTVGRILRMPEPDKKGDYKNSPELRTGFLFTNYRREEVVIPDQSNKNKPCIHRALLKVKFKNSVKDLKLESAFISRIDYGDIAYSSEFQLSFIKTMNKYFYISQKDFLSEKQQKLGVPLTPRLNNSLVVNAEFRDFDNMSMDFKKKGTDIDFEISQNDIEKLFNYLIYHILKEQTDEDAKISNIARSWSPLKSAIRIWLKDIFGEESNFYYRVFISDIMEGAGSKFKPAITQALKDYRPILNKILEKRREQEQEKERLMFTIQDEYLFTEDYEEIDQDLCVLEQCFIKKDYAGRENEQKFIKYIDSKSKYLSWWFKNGDIGKDYFSLRYFNTAEQKERLFYPDWIIKLKDGRVGIFDTKAGRTLNTEGRASGLAEKIKELGKNYIGGIVKFANGIFYYCNSLEYNDQTESNNKWIRLEEVFEK